MLPSVLYTGTGTGDLKLSLVLYLYKSKGVDLNVLFRALKNGKEAERRLDKKNMLKTASIKLKK